RADGTHRDATARLFLGDDLAARSARNPGPGQRPARDPAGVGEHAGYPLARTPGGGGDENFFPPLPTRPGAVPPPAPPAKARRAGAHRLGTGPAEGPLHRPPHAREGRWAAAERGRPGVRPGVPRPGGCFPPGPAPPRRGAIPVAPPAGATRRDLPRRRP